MFKRILFWGIFITALTACDEGLAPVKAQSQPRVIVLEEKDHGRKLNLKKGEILVLQLKAQFGTGYSWQLKSYDLVFKVNQ